jgi:hypothetical protein
MITSIFPGCFLKSSWAMLAKIGQIPGRKPLRTIRLSGKIGQKLRPNEMDIPLCHNLKLRALYFQRSIDRQRHLKHSEGIIMPYLE